MECKWYLEIGKFVLKTYVQNFMSFLEHVIRFSVRRTDFLTYTVDK